MADILDGAAAAIADDFSEFGPRCVQEAIRLLENDNTIPFIARYRRRQTGGMDAGHLRELKTSYDVLRSVQTKVQKIIAKDGDTIPKAVQCSLRHAKTLEEVNDLYSPFKKGGKGTLAERARSHGLEPPSKEILEAPNYNICLQKYIKSNVEGLTTLKDIQTGIQHIIADTISKDEQLNATVNKYLRKQVSIETKTTEAKKKADKEKKFGNYYEFSISTERIRSHQILAINRGEELKILTVRIFMSENASGAILTWLNKKWIPNRATAFNRSLLTAAVEDSFKRLIEKKYLKRIRVRLTTKAEHEAVEVFTNNLQKLLLAPPVRGKITLGVDPGFKHGCKLAALDKHGQVLDTAVVHPFRELQHLAEQTVERIVRKNQCDIIAIGNGTACRETENFIANMIKKGVFKPLEVSYCIVNESGASVWSVTKEADEEFPNLDPNLRSAVSIGRRLQDPLLELVKIEPKHIGVGMYQHDISESLLKAALEGVLEDCVSFVGVDLNACSSAVLRRIAGLGAKKAESIIEWRAKNGPFINRSQLLSVKGLGKKCFEQCAGFVRINSKGDVPRSQAKQQRKTEPTRKRKADVDLNLTSKKRKLGADVALPEPLDQTMIHPESYAVTYRLLENIDAETDLIGTPKIVQLLEKASGTGFNELLENLHTDEETLRLIIQGLQQPLGYDLRSEMEQPMFKKELRSIDDLTVGESVTGVVNNVTSFGVFVDFGVGRDGLIYQSNLGNCKDLGPGEKCKCIVISIDKSRQRIGLKFKCRTSSVPLLKK